MFRMVLFFMLLFPFVSVQGQKAGATRISPDLDKQLKTGRGDSLVISISFKGPASFLDSLHVKELPGGHFISKMARPDISKLALHPGVVFINELHIPREELSTGAYDLTLNGISYVHARFSQLQGNALRVSVKERDFDTTDIDLKGRIFHSGLESGSVTAHASLMATIIGGAANSSPIAMGAAPGSDLSSSSFLNLFPDAAAFMNSVSVQNHSYGTIVESFYGNEAAAYDQQANQLPFLLHVFSSGNSGNQAPATGAYAGLNGMANLTGNFKQAKNIITVGSVDSAAVVMPLSSKGPAFDGRIKPELVAYGEDGSSGAAALVSGAALLVQDAYKNLHATLPDATLVKAALLNGADDIGPAHPDYLTGYGNLNACRAVQTVLEGRYAEGLLMQDEIQNLPLQVPAGMAGVKLLLAWNDPASQPGTAHALVNDLDMQLQLTATGQSWDPWVPDPSNNISALQSPAQRKTDTLNNVEQVTLDLPAAGNYNIQIRGSRVNSAGQKYFLVYQFDTASSFQFTYPAHSDHLVAGNTHWLRWETTLSGPAQIEYATNGNNWRIAGSIPDLAQKFMTWQVPDTVTTAVLRMKTVSGIAGISDSFTISPQLSLSVGFNCADSFLLFWNALPVAAYRLYELGSEKLEPFLLTNDTAVVLGRQQHPSLYYSISPLINGKEGIRANTLNYTTQGTGCYLKSFFLQAQTNSVALFKAELGTSYGVASVRLEKQVNGHYQVLRTIDHPQQLEFLLADSSLTQGENHYRFVIQLNNGALIYSNDEIVYWLPGAPVLLYPVPVPQGSALHIIIKESGRYSLQLSDMNGRQVIRQDLNSNVSQINTRFLARGMYLARIFDNKGKAFTEKLVIY